MFHLSRGFAGIAGLALLLGATDLPGAEWSLFAGPSINHVQLMRDSKTTMGWVGGVRLFPSSQFGVEVAYRHVNQISDSFPVDPVYNSEYAIPYSTLVLKGSRTLNVSMEQVESFVLARLQPAGYLTFETGIGACYSITSVESNQFFRPPVQVGQQPRLQRIYDDRRENISLVTKAAAERQFSSRMAVSLDVNFTAFPLISPLGFYPRADIGRRRMGIGSLGVSARCIW